MNYEILETKTGITTTRRTIVIKLVDNHHIITTSQKKLGDMRADKASSTRHQHLLVADMRKHESFVLVQVCEINRATGTSDRRRRTLLLLLGHDALVRFLPGMEDGHTFHMRKRHFVCLLEASGTVKFQQALVPPGMSKSEGW